MEKNISLSYSKIGTFLECPKKYYFQYILKLPTKPKYYYSFGETIHKVLEDMYNPSKSLNKLPRLSELLLLVDEYWIGTGFWNEEHEEEAKSEAKELLRDFYKKNIFDFKPAFSVEEKIYFNICGINIAGKIDRIDKLPGNEFEIIDYKTGDGISTSNINFIDRLQLIIYSLGFKAKYSFRAKLTSWYFLKKNEKLTIELNEEDFLKGEETIKEVSKRIIDSSFERKENEFCQYCDFIEACQE